MHSQLNSGRRHYFLEPKRRSHGLIYEAALLLCDAREIWCTFRNKTNTSVFFFLRICWHTLCLTRGRFIFKNFKLDLKNQQFLGVSEFFRHHRNPFHPSQGVQGARRFRRNCQKDVKILAPCESAKQQTPIAGIQKPEASKKRICLNKN